MISSGETHMQQQQSSRYWIGCSLALLLAIVLGGCTKDVHGGGVVTLYSVIDGEPGEATINLSFKCQDKKNTISGTLTWHDRTNGVKFKARLPETPVTVIASEYPEISTCKDAAAFADSLGASTNVAIINPKGQEIGQAVLVVDEPGATAACGFASEVSITASGPFQYVAFGCLDRGKIVFK
jgi:hypothetical protein